MVIKRCNVGAVLVAFFTFVNYDGILILFIRNTYNDSSNRICEILVLKVFD